MTAHIVLNAVYNLHCGRGVDKVIGADFDRRGPCEQELDGVTGGSDPSHADDGQLDRLRRLPDHTQRYGLDCGPREPARDRREDGTATLGIDGHAEERIDHRDGVSPLCLYGTGDLGDVRDIG